MYKILDYLNKIAGDDWSLLDGILFRGCFRGVYKSCHKPLGAIQRKFKKKILKSKNSTSHVRENVNFDMIRGNLSFIRGSEIGFRLHMSQDRFLIFLKIFHVHFQM